MIQILMIEDDQEITDLLKQFLQKYNMQVSGVDTPSLALKTLEMDHFDLIILDLSLPEMDGLDLCKEICKLYNTPIIISTARGDLSDKVIGLEIGADDYLPKPYEPRELVARIQSVLRRYQSTQPQENNPFCIIEDKMQIKKDGDILKLTLAEYEILRLFIQKKGIVISRDFIANNVDSLGWDSSDRSIDVIISRIRQKIGGDTIKTIRGVGYKFIG